jgi:hypothetical protein
MFGTNLTNLYRSIAGEVKPANKNTFLTDFYERIRSQGLAVNNKFYVNIILNSNLLQTNLNWNPAVQKRMSVNCQSASIPSKSISTAEFKAYGPSIKVPYNTTFQPIEISFFVGTDMFERYFFDAWMQNIQDPKSRDMNYYNEYISDIEIFVMPKFIDSFEDVLKNADSIFKITLKEAYPVTVTPIILNNGSTQYLTVNVEFNYKYYDINSELEKELASKELDNLLNEVNNNGKPKGTILDQLFRNQNTGELLNTVSSNLIFLKNIFS